MRHISGAFFIFGYNAGMLDITILSVGKIKEPYFQSAVLEFCKRLGPYAKIKMASIKAEAFSDNDKVKAKENESKRILEYLTKRQDAKIILLTEEGREYTSPEFARYLGNINQPIIFVIGGSLGFSAELKARFNEHLSLSRLTFLHEMAQVLLLEQIYRATTILAGKSYHH